MRSWFGKAGAAVGVALVLAMGSSERAQAQGVTTGAISGFVQDSSGATAGKESHESRF